jgi:hypothetical protein
MHNGCSEGAASAGLEWHLAGPIRAVDEPRESSRGAGSGRIDRAIDRPRAGRGRRRRAHPGEPDGSAGTGRQRDFEQLLGTARRHGGGDKQADSQLDGDGRKQDRRETGLLAKGSQVES